MADPYLGEIRLVAFNFAPHGWQICAGQTLSISTNAALFSLLGTSYGGNGITTFQLPDFRGRAMISMGQGPGLNSYVEGQVGGTESVTLTTGALPAHSHALAINANPGSVTSPSGAFPAVSPLALGNVFGSSASTSMPNGTIQSTGGGQSHPNLMPTLVLNYIIAVAGIFPSRN